MSDPAAQEVHLLVLGRGLRAFVDGYVAVLLPAYLLALGYGTWQVGLLSSATLLGSALATLALGAWGHHAPPRLLLLGAALLMAVTGLGFAGLSAFWPLLLVAFVGTLNPSSGDVSVFLPLEHSRLSLAADGHARTRLFARYSLTGTLCAALGALAAAVPDALTSLGFDRLVALRAMFAVYAGVGVLLCVLYARLSAGPVPDHAAVPAPLGPSRRIVVKLAALFSVDAFAGGLVVNSLLALSQMDVPTRTAYVMSVVTPAERAAAASFTAVPRSLAAALSPSLGGALLASGWLAAPLVACAFLKIAYDLALWRGFRQSDSVVSHVETK